MGVRRREAPTGLRDVQRLDIFPSGGLIENAYSELLQPFWHKGYLRLKKLRKFTEYHEWQFQITLKPDLNNFQVHVLVNHCGLGQFEQVHSFQYRYSLQDPHLQSSMWLQLLLPLSPKSRIPIVCHHALQCPADLFWSPHRDTWDTCPASYTSITLT